MRWWKRKRVTLTLFAVVLIAAASWTGLNWLRMSRTAVRVDGAWQRVEAASRARLALSANVMRSAPLDSFLGSEPANELRRAAARVAATSLGPTWTGDAEAYRDYLAAQADLSAAFARFWRAGPAEPSSLAGRVGADLRRSQDEMETLLAAGIADLEGSVGSFRESARGFPGSILAGRMYGDALGTLAPLLAAHPVANEDASGVEH